MLDPISALAFELHASKGVFALLLGSGISRSAKIPTGWEITLDLVRKVAALSDAAEITDPAAWYTDKFGRAPDYSELLNTLSTTPAQRQQVIAPYIEPSTEERNRGEKLPTAAHIAIAKLMAEGYIKVVITTNFDRLLELALADLGVNPTVLSSADHVAGAIPLVHAGPTIIKVHGDYLDTRIRNTQDELAGYESAIDKLLDRVFDEFGLVVCGWSADWDVALKAAIDRAPSRRYPMYWSARGEPSAAAKGLIERRGGRRVPIADADGFFGELSTKVSALESLSRPHPLSADLAVAMLKEYLPEPRHRIRLNDLVNGERARTLGVLDSQGTHLHAISNDVLVKEVRRYEASIDVLLPLAYYAGIWSEGEQCEPWVALVHELAARGKDVSGNRALIDLIAYPACLVMHAFLLGAVVGKKPASFGAMAGSEADFSGFGAVKLGDRMNATALIRDRGQERFKALPGHENDSVALSERIAELLRPIAKNELPSEASFNEAFCRLELALVFGFVEWRYGESTTSDRLWILPGLYRYQSSISSKIIQEWKSKHAEHGLESELCVMAALKKVPRFDDIAQLATRSALFD